jgi:hypothetical protein
VGIVSVLLPADELLPAESLMDGMVALRRNASLGLNLRHHDQLSILLAVSVVSRL